MSRRTKKPVSPTHTVSTVTGRMSMGQPHMVIPPDFVAVEDRNLLGRPVEDADVAALGEALASWGKMAGCEVIGSFRVQTLSVDTDGLGVGMKPQAVANVGLLVAGSDDCVGPILRAVPKLVDAKRVWLVVET